MKNSPAFEEDRGRGLPLFSLDLAGFRKFVSLLVLENGKPMRLYAEQLVMLREFFEGARETVILIPKKNGKTALLAALGLFHLLTTNDADVAIVAESQKQAMRMFQAMRGFIRRSPVLRDSGVFDVLPGFKEIRRLEPGGKDWDGRIVVYSNDPVTFDGWLGTLGFIDEYHRGDSAETYGLMREGIGPRGGQMVTISTAGNDETSPLGFLRSKAYSLPGFAREGAHRFVTTGDFAFHEWALDIDEDGEDIDLVKTANPAPWLTVAELRRRKESPSMQPWQWDRFTCGKWAAGEYSAINPREWSARARPGCGPPPGAPGVIVGGDLSQKGDDSAFVPVWRADGSEVVTVGQPVILHPPGDGSSLMFEDMLDVVITMAERWPKLTVVLDPLAGGVYLAQLIERELPEVTLATYSQTWEPMSLASGRLAVAIAEGHLEHPDDAELNSHVLAAGVRWSGERWRFAKPQGRDVKIDALIALAMAHSVLVGDGGEPEYETAGFS